MKMEKRTFADQSNSIVDFYKVREASERTTLRLQRRNPPMSCI